MSILDGGVAEIGSAVLGGIGNAITGGGANKERRKDRAEQQREFNLQMRQRQNEFARTQGSSEGDQAVAARRQLDMAPLRDRLLHTMQLRAGLAPQAMQAHDIFNPGISAATPQLGGIDRQAMQQGMAGYTPGAGGVNTQVLQQLIQKLGYDPTHPIPPGQQPFQPTQDPAIGVNGESRPGDFRVNDWLRMAAYNGPMGAMRRMADEAKQKLEHYYQQFPGQRPGIPGNQAPNMHPGAM